MGHAEMRNCCSQHSLEMSLASIAHKYVVSQHNTSGEFVLLELHQSPEYGLQWIQPSSYLRARSGYMCFMASRKLNGHRIIYSSLHLGILPDLNASHCKEALEYMS